MDGCQYPCELHHGRVQFIEENVALAINVYSSTATEDFENVSRSCKEECSDAEIES
jgi:hypothetical protein